VAVGAVPFPWVKVELVPNDVLASGWLCVCIDCGRKKWSSEMVCIYPISTSLATSPWHAEGKRQPRPTPQQWQQVAANAGVAKMKI
jgi:hypothetical protein